jgi:hypothetical protein
MAVAPIEKRVAALEAEVTRLRQELETVKRPSTPWWQEIYGTFAGDPLHQEAMRLGRDYRESLRPRPRGRPSKESTKRRIHRKRR